MLKITENKELTEKLTSQVEEIVLKTHVEGKVIARKVERMTAILTALAEDGAEMKRPEIVKQYGSNATTVHREVAILKKAGLIRLKGGRKMGAYVLTDKGKEMVMCSS